MTGSRDYSAIPMAPTHNTAFCDLLLKANADPDAAVAELLDSGTQLMTLNLLREYFTQPGLDIALVPQNIAAFGTLIARKIRGSVEATGRAAKRDAKVKAATTPAVAAATLDDLSSFG